MSLVVTNPQRIITNRNPEAHLSSIQLFSICRLIVGLRNYLLCTKQTKCATVAYIVKHSAATQLDISLVGGGLNRAKRRVSWTYIHQTAMDADVAL